MRYGCVVSDLYQQRRCSVDSRCVPARLGLLRLRDDVLTIGIGEQLVDVETVDLRRQLADQVVRHPSLVLAALVAVQRLLEVPELVLLARRQQEPVRLDGVFPDERETSELRLDLPWTDVLVDHRREKSLGVRAAGRALRVGPLDECDRGIRRPENSSVLGNPGKVDNRVLGRRSARATPDERDGNERQGGCDRHREREDDGAPRWSLVRAHSPP